MYIQFDIVCHVVSSISRYEMLEQPQTFTSESTKAYKYQKRIENIFHVGLMIVLKMFST